MEPEVEIFKIINGNRYEFVDCFLEFKEAIDYADNLYLKDDIFSIIYPETKDGCVLYSVYARLTDKTKK